ADAIRPHLGWGRPIDVDRLAAAAGLSVERARSALMFLAAQGRVGYDLARGDYFHRELPLRAEALSKMNPRLAEARELIDAGKVRLEAGGARRRSGDVERRVAFATDHARCTSPC